MMEEMLEEMLLERYIAYQIECKDDGPDARYVFEFDIQSAGLRKKLKDHTLKRKNAKSSDQKLINMLGTAMTKGELRAQRNIRFLNMTPDQQAFIRKVLRDSFTQKELELMGKGGLVVRVIPVKEGTYGEYCRKQRGMETPEIHLSHELNEDTIAHEFIHHIRTVDEVRVGFSRTAYKIVNGTYDKTFYNANESDIHNFEEAATVAETTARTKGPATSISGYYDYVGEVSRKEAYDSDRKRLTGNPQSIDINKTKGIKGKAATNCINEEFAKTHIASMVMNGRTALNSYYILNQKQ